MGHGICGPPAKTCAFSEASARTWKNTATEGCGIDENAHPAKRRRNGPPSRKLFSNNELRGWPTARPSLYWYGLGSNAGMYEADGIKSRPKEHWACSPVSVNLP
jgi:hypothetical protein